MQRTVRRSRLGACYTEKTLGSYCRVISCNCRHKPE